MCVESFNDVVRREDKEPRKGVRWGRRDGEISFDGKNSEKY